MLCPAVHYEGQDGTVQQNRRRQQALDLQGEDEDWWINGRVTFSLFISPFSLFIQAFSLDSGSQEQLSVCFCVWSL